MNASSHNPSFLRICIPLLLTAVLSVMFFPGASTARGATADDSASSTISDRTSLTALLADPNSDALANGACVHCAGFGKPGDGGGGYFRVRPRAKDEKDNGGTVLLLRDGRVLERLVTGEPVDVRWFGAVAGTDFGGNTAALSANTAAVQTAADIGAPDYVLHGVYHVNRTIHFKGTLRSLNGGSGGFALDGIFLHAGLDTDGLVIEPPVRDLVVRGIGVTNASYYADTSVGVTSLSGMGIRIGAVSKGNVPELRMYDCKARGFGTGFHVYGAFLARYDGCRAEDCRLGFLSGSDDATTNLFVNCYTKAACGWDVYSNGATFINCAWDAAKLVWENARWETRGTNGHYDLCVWRLRGGTFRLISCAIEGFSIKPFRLTGTDGDGSSNSARWATSGTPKTFDVIYAEGSSQRIVSVEGLRFCGFINTSMPDVISILTARHKTKLAVYRLEDFVYDIVDGNGKSTDGGSPENEACLQLWDLSGKPGGELHLSGLFPSTRGTLRENGWTFRDNGVHVIGSLPDSKSAPLPEGKDAPKP